MSSGVEDTARATGRVELRLALAAEVTKATLEVDGALVAELTRNDFGAFTGAVALEEGTHDLVARTYADDALIGASNPTPMAVVANAVTHATLRVFDVSPAPVASYGPILASLAYPTTIAAGASATFALNAVSPVGAAIDYAWTSSCADAAFSTQTGTTTWTKPTPGNCTIDVAATSSGYALTQRFTIIVLPPSSAAGAASVDLDFVYRPHVTLALGSTCFAFANDGNHACQELVASPSQVPFDLTVSDWGGSTMASRSLTSSCGGRFAIHEQHDAYLRGVWVPPVAGGVCSFEARATSADGLTASAPIAVLAVPGTPIATVPVTLSAVLHGVGANCALTEAGASCGSVAAGKKLWVGGASTPGVLVEIEDSCAGPQRWNPSVTSFGMPSWLLTSAPGTTCTATARGTSVSGEVKTLKASYTIAN